MADLTGQQVDDYRLIRLAVLNVVITANVAAFGLS